MKTIRKILFGRWWLLAVALGGIGLNGCIYVHGHHDHHWHDWR